VLLPWRVPRRCALRITGLVGRLEVGLRLVCIPSIALPTALAMRYWITADGMWPPDKYVLGLCRILKMLELFAYKTSFA